MGRFKASKLIAIESWGVLRHDKEMLLFPLLSVVLSFALTAVFLLFIFFSVLGGDWMQIKNIEANELDPMAYVLFFVFYVLNFFIINFFQSAVFIMTNARFSGQDHTFSQTLKETMTRVDRIFIWSLISATVGIILKIISDKFKQIGIIVSMIFGSAWSVLTYFSLPSLVIGQTTVTGSFKESASLIRKTWGETIIINFGAGLFFGVLNILTIFVCLGLALLIPEATVFFVLVLIVLLVLITTISSILGSIFKLAIYQYAKTGVIPQSFSSELVLNAIKSK